MKSMNYELGVAAEKKVIEHYTLIGFNLLKHRYKTKHGEIDAIFANDKELLFVEVKFRKAIHNNELLTKKQILRYIDTAKEFLANHDSFYDYYMRFDLAIVDKNFKINIIENAWEEFD